MLPEAAVFFLDGGVVDAGEAAVPRLTQKQLGRAQGYDWRGNIRELQNVRERGLILSSGGQGEGTAGGEGEIVSEEEWRRRERCGGRGSGGGPPSCWESRRRRWLHE